MRPAHNGFIVGSNPTGSTNKGRIMFTVETEFDRTIVTVMDETGNREDLIVVLSEQGIFLKQFDEAQVRNIVLHVTEKQISDMYLALNSTDGTFISE